jgi:hypothetical protein
MSILEAIERERLNYPLHTHIYGYAVNAMLDRIAAEAEKLESLNKILTEQAAAWKKKCYGLALKIDFPQPRVMKPWTDDCKPDDDENVLLCITAHDGSSLILDDPVWINQQIKNTGICDGYKITHWLEIEPTPILP